MPESLILSFLEQLAHVKRDPSGSQTGGRNPSRIEQMDKELQSIIPGVQNRGELIRTKLAPLQDEVTEDIFYKLKEKIANIAQNEITAHTNINAYASTSRNISESWLKFRIEKNILETKAMAHLQVSYNVLHTKLKLCLLCLSVFPENSVIKMRSLIYWWIGEGLVIAENNKSVEETAKYYCKELMKAGMIKPVRKTSLSTLDSCTLHPWIQRMVCSIAKRAHFFDFDEDTGKLIADSTSSHRTFLTRGNSEIIRGAPEDLFTVFNIDEENLEFKREWFSKLKKIVVLHLGKWHDSTKYHIEARNNEFLKGLNGQKHLRYLSLQGISRISELPDSVSNLTNVRILDLRACHNLEKLSSGITSLTKLTHLDVSECYLLECMPKGLEFLSELQVLKGFVIGDSKMKEAGKLADLVKLKKLRKLSIHVGTNVTVEEKELDQLKHLQSLRILTISWGRVFHEESSNAATTTSLSILPQELEKLELQCFPQSKAPGWLRPSALINLKRLYIRGGKLESLVKEENHSWKVEILRLKFLTEFEIEWSELLNAFPNTVYIEKIQCNKVNASPVEGVWARRMG